METLLLSLLFWISQHTHFAYDVDNGIPDLRAADPMTMAALVVNNASVPIPDQDNASFKDYANQLEAVYDHKRKIILINTNINPASDYGRSVIVHELVHFIQYQQNEHHQVACLSALEKDAYAIQAKYMEAHDVPKNFDTLTVMLRSMCLDDAR